MLCHLQASQSSKNSECEAVDSKVSKTMQKKIIWPQWTAGIGVLLLLILIGGMGGWTSPYLAQLTADDSPLHITLNEASWVASLTNLGRLIGAIVGSISVDYLGSKKTVLFAGVPIALGWVFIIVADSVAWLYAARILNGIGVGMAFGSFPLYIGEISDPNIRGALVSLALGGVPLGSFLGSLMGAYMNMRLFAWIVLIPNTIFIILFLWLPESPHFLVRMDQIENAKKSILWYHRQADAKAEVESLKHFVSATSALSFMDKLREFNTPRNRKSGVLIVMLFMFMQFSGLNTIIFYMEIILTEGKVTILDPATVVIIIGILGTVSGLLAMYFVDKCGRKSLLIVSSVGVGVSMTTLGAHFMLLYFDYDPTELEWIPIASLITFQISICFGLIPIPSTVLSELFAPNIKGIAACLANICSGLFAFLASKTYQPLVDVIGEQYVFWMYAAIMILVAVPYVALMMPETKGKSLEEIQDSLMKNSVVPSKNEKSENGVYTISDSVFKYISPDPIEVIR